MELKFEEIYEENETTNDINYVNYWSNATTNSITEQKKPKVSYDDILSSLNMVVRNGVLQFAKPVSQPTKSQPTKTQAPQSQKKQVTIRQQPQLQRQPQQFQQNNYIINKHFKDYKQEQEQQEQQEQQEKKPLTKEEYRQMVIQDYINRQQAQMRIAQIKSKKLLFDTRNINIAPTQMPRDMNKLFHF